MMRLIFRRVPLRRVPPAGVGARRFSGKALSAEAGADTSTAATDPFHDACERGDAQCVEQFLRAGQVDVNAGDPQRANTTPLHLAARRGFADVARLLLAHGANANARGAWDLTSLMYTSVFNQPVLASLLLEHGADTALVDKKGKTALDHALGEKNLGVVAVLNESQRNNQNDDGFT